MCWIVEIVEDGIHRGRLSKCGQKRYSHPAEYDYQQLQKASVQLLSCALDFYTDPKHYFPCDLSEKDLDILYKELARRVLSEQENFDVLAV